MTTPEHFIPGSRSPEDETEDRQAVKNEPGDRSDGEGKGADPKELLVADIVRYLGGLARLHQDRRTGNPGVSVGLHCLTKALKPHRHRTLEELAVLLSGLQPASKREQNSRKPRVELPENLVALDKDEIDRILCDDQYLKKQIIELGNCRFGIPRGKLARLSKPEAVASIRAALDNERSLEVLSRQAKLAGQRRGGWSEHRNNEATSAKTTVTTPVV